MVTWGATKFLHKIPSLGNLEKFGQKELVHVGSLVSHASNFCRKPSRSRSHGASPDNANQFGANGSGSACGFHWETCRRMYDAFSVRGKKLESEGPAPCGLVVKGQSMLLRTWTLRPDNAVEPAHYQNRRKRGSHANCQRFGARVYIAHFQVFSKDYSHHWNTNHGWFPPREEWWPRGPDVKIIRNYGWLWVRV